MNQPQPNPAKAREFLDAAFGAVEAAYPGALIEIAYGWPGKSAITRARLFENTADGRREAAEFAARVTLDEQTSVYFAPSLRKPGTERAKRSKKADVLGSPLVWADFDSPGSPQSARAIYTERGFPPHRIVVTGRRPETRAQAFWIFDDLVTDQGALDELLAGAHVRLDMVSDPKVINADRVMRLPGTLSWPKEGKEGRQLEPTELAVPGGAPKRPHPIADAPKLFPPRDPIAARKNEDAPPGGLDLLNAPPPEPSTGPPPAPSPAPAPAPAAPEPDFDFLGRRIEGRDEHAMRIIGGAIRNLAARLGRWPTADEIAADAWPTYEHSVAPKRPIAGEEHRAGLEREGRGWTWFREKCATHARRAAAGQIAGLETIERAREAVAMNAAQQPPPALPGAPTAGIPGPPRIARFTPFSLGDGRGIPRRRWLYGRHLIRGYVSATISPGGVGKSSLTLVEALAMATARPLLGETPERPLRVWAWNGEDPLEESHRRITAAALHFGIRPDQVEGRIFLDSGREQELKIAITGRDGVHLNEHVIESVIEHAKANEIDAIIVDPLVSSHSVPENDNGAIDAVVKAWNRVAQECDCAVELVHHSRKPPGGVGHTETTVDDARGAGALLAAVRSARTLNRMSEKDAEKFGVESRWRWAYFRVDNGKANLAPPAEVATWRFMESVDLPNGEGDDPGDSVGVATPWTPPNAFDGVSPEHTAEVQARLAKAEGDGVPCRKDWRAATWAGYVVGEVVGFNTTDPSGRRRAESMLKKWVEAGVLREIDVPDEHRKPRPCITSGARF
jgi:hypothetical protein